MTLHASSKPSDQSSHEHFYHEITVLKTHSTSKALPLLHFPNLHQIFYILRSSWESPTRFGGKFSIPKSNCLPKVHLCELFELGSTVSKGKMVSMKHFPGPPTKICSTPAILPDCRTSKPLQLYLGDAIASSGKLMWWSTSRIARALGCSVFSAYRIPFSRSWQSQWETQRSCCEL